MSSAAPLLPGLLLVLLLAATVLLQSQPSSAAPVITSISGCQANPLNANYTMNCDLPINLTITGTGFTALTTVTITTRPGVRFGCSLLNLAIDNSTADSSSTAYCYVYLRGRGWIPWQTPLNVTAVDSTVSPALTSPVFPGLTVLPIVPVVTAVSGCTDVGNTTVDCLPAELTLTLTGSNFTKLSWFSSVLTVQINAPAIVNTNGPTIINDTTMVLPLRSAYTYVLTEAMYGTSIALSIAYGGDLLAPFNITLAPLPAPKIYSVAGVNCLGNSSSTVNGVVVAGTTDCYPGFSLISITADYLYSENVTVGGWPCLANAYNRDPTRSLVYSIVCLPQVGAGYLVQRPLDVTLTSSFVVNVPAAVTFNSLPTITAIASAECPGDGTGWTVYTSLKCQPGAAIILYGLNFVITGSGGALTPTVLVWDRTGSSSMLCQQPALINATSITCVLPTPPDNSDAWEQFYDSLTTSVSLSYSAAGLTSNRFSAGLYANLVGPTLSSVTGCASSSGPLSVSDCRVGDVLTITGTNFLAERVSVQASGSWSCANVTVASWSSLTCVVVEPYQPIPAGEQLVCSVITRLNNSLFASGAFYVTLATTSPASSSSSSSNTKAVDRAVPIAVVLVVLLLAVGALRWWRKSAVKRDSPSHPDNRSAESSNWLPSDHSASDAAASNTELGVYSNSA